MHVHVYTRHMYMSRVRRVLFIPQVATAASTAAATSPCRACALHVVHTDSICYVCVEVYAYMCLLCAVCIVHAILCTRQMVRIAYTQILTPYL